MIKKLIFSIPLMLICCLLLSGKAFAAAASDIEILVASPIDSLVDESGVVAVEQFPAKIPICVTAKTGALADIELEYGGQTTDIKENYTLVIENKEKCGPYTITAKTDEGAVLTITANVVFQVKATFDVRYRTIGMNVKEIYEGEKLFKSFQEAQRIDLVNANTIAGHEQERIAGWINQNDGGTYTLKGSLVVEIYSFSTGKIFGVYDTGQDFEALTTRFGWTPKALTAFRTMGKTALSYQAPVKIDVNATWCNESNKKEIYGKLSAQDKGVPALLFPYQTTAVTFSKDDILLSRNYQYMGLEWQYVPQTGQYTDGKSKTLSEITQRINYQIPVTDFYFKFLPQDGNDLSVVIRAPATVNRGTDYSFTVIYMNSGEGTAYDVPLKGTVDGAGIGEIPSLQDFSPNQSKTCTVKRTANTTASEIQLWANIGVPEGFIDGNLGNNTATATIKVVDPQQQGSPSPTNNPDDPGQPDNPDNPGTLPDEPSEPKESCNLSTSILAAPTVYEGEQYSYTVKFTNQSAMPLKDVVLQSKNNEVALSQIPQTADFNPQETKAYTITGTAGSAGEVYRLWSCIEAPESFKDENPNDNTAVSSITVVKRTSGIPDNPEDPENPENPNDPEDPENPDDPDNPANSACDVWVNLSCPPSVNEQEEYSITVHFANSTDKVLSGVNLNLSIDGNTASSVPASADFKAYEIKTFVVKSTAGDKGGAIQLSAQVSPPANYEDTNMNNNQASATITVQERPYDLDVQRITPDQYKENQTVISTVKVSNKGSMDFAPGQRVTVLFEVPELSLKRRMDAVIMEQGTWNVVSFKWDTPNVQADKTITLIATINPDHTLDNESSTSNNVYTQKAVIRDISYGEPDESRAIPDPPQRSDQPKVTWWEQRYENGQFIWHEYYAVLKVSATLDYDTKGKGYLKSGYGYSITVTTSVDTNYDRPELITSPQTAEIYLPEYSYITAIPLDKVGGQFVFRENSASPFHYRKQYIPVWFPDDTDYIVQLLVADVHTPGGSLSKWLTGGDLKIHVVDSMYDDDVTTGN